MRRPSSAHVIAFIALFAALGGGAYAAKTIGASDIKRGAVRAKHIKNGNVLLADLSRAVRVQLARTGATGPRGPRGARGRRGRLGATGPTGPGGPAGAPGATGSVADTLASGRTLRGTYVLNGNGDETALTFASQLASAPAPHWIAGPLTAPECTGSAAQPTAAPGHLCIYEASGDGAPLRGVFDPATGASGAASRFGAGLLLDGAGDMRSAGTWAVTAP